MAINPEKHFQRLPESFSGTSKVIDVTTSDKAYGIVLDSPEEVAEALRTYNGEGRKGAIGTGATQQELFDAFGDSHGGLAQKLLLEGGRMMGQGFTQRLIPQVLADLQNKGRFYKDFDYDAMGTNFMKTGVTAQKVDDRYVLEFQAAYVGREPEQKLAEKLGKPLAHRYSSVSAQLSVVDDWWFNADLLELLVDLPIDRFHLPAAAEYIGKWGESGRRPKITFEHNRQTFGLEIRIDAYLHAKAEGVDGLEAYYVKARHNSVMGAAWRTEYGTAPARIVNPSLELTITLPKEHYETPPIVKPNQIKAVKEARDHIADLLRPRK